MLHTAEPSAVAHPIHLEDPSGRDLRSEVRDWLDRELRPEFRRSAANADYLPAEAHRQAVAFCQRLHARGWFVPHWPVEFGGGGRPIVDQVISARSSPMQAHRLSTITA